MYSKIRQAWEISRQQAELRDVTTVYILGAATTGGRRWKQFLTSASNMNQTTTGYFQALSDIQLK